MLDSILRDKVGDTHISFVRISQCPFCKSGVGTPPIYKYLRRIDTLKHSLYTITECEVCKKPFMAIYSPTSIMHDEVFVKYKCIPRAITKTEYHDIILAISPDFVSIYHEAEAAEQYGLLQVAGPGYRKALEFLIKDYLIFKDPEKKTDVEGKSLGNLAAELPHEKLRKSAQNAVKLGNNQTHYRMVYQDSDMTTLKKCIEATVYWIMMEETTDIILVKTK